MSLRLVRSPLAPKTVITAESIRLLLLMLDNYKVTIFLITCHMKYRPFAETNQNIASGTPRPAFIRGLKSV
jgi:hypothetical protein